MLTSAVGASVEIGATVASKTAAFITKNVMGLLLFPRGLPGGLDGGWSDYGPAVGCCDGVGRLCCGQEAYR